MLLLETCGKVLPFSTVAIFFFFYINLEDFTDVISGHLLRACTFEYGPCSSLELGTS
jgi:hypothetical protein